MSALDWLAQPGSRLLTFSLLHFVWQAPVICLLLLAVVDLCKLRRPTARYACSLVGLLALVTCPLATFAWLANERTVVLPSEGLELPLLSLSSRDLSSWNWLEAVQPFALAAWLAGVILFGSRLIVGAVGISRLRRSRLPLPPKLMAIVERLGKQLRMEADGVVFLSKQAADAMAVGLIRPLVLVPAVWATDMPLSMLEAVIAHELAHLARRDLWINMLQRIAETLLFYHPAVWWLSRRLRIERELCADELAVAATGNRVAYAEALEHIASRGSAEFRPALAAFLRGETDMRLLQRVRNILGKPADERSRLWPAGLIALALPLGLWAASAVSGVAIADDEDGDRKKPTIKRERDEGDSERRVTIRKEPRERDDDSDERIVQLRFTKPHPPERDEIVEERVIKRDGKPIYEVQYGRKDLRDDGGDRRMDELTALVKKLAVQVERLQDEVKELRGASASDRRGRYREEEEARARKQEAEQLARRRDEETRKRAIEQDRERDDEARERAEQKERAVRATREQVELKLRAIDKEGREETERGIAVRQREIAELAARKAGEAAGRVKKELAEKLEVEVKEKVEAAREKAEAAKEKARRAIEEKLKALKEDGDEVTEKELERIKRKLADEQALLKSPGDKPTIRLRKEPQ